jgi:signal transduction histidine kinase
LTALSPDAVDEKLFIPRVVLTNFLISDKPVPVGPNSPLKESISITKALTLSHSQNTLSFEFTALSYADPERTRYRYRLEGLDSGWTEVANTQRLTRYPTLAPGDYIFRVEARSSRGNWTEKGAEVHIAILPPWWATGPFRAACALAVGLIVWLLWRLRVRQMAEQLNLRFEERLRERTRIARELHDTLLQSFQGVVFRFQAVRNMLPWRPDEAIEALDNALERTDQAIAEGRDAIQGLRSSAAITNELAQAVRALGEELSFRDSTLHSAKFDVVVEGPPQDLHPILRDEVYAIAREAVRNAFRHAQARNIEADIRYSGSLFQLRIRDDGTGIDPEVVAEGRAGHYGVPGMRERAKRIGGKLDVWTGTGAGTEIELSIPGSIAYARSPGGTVRGLFRKKAANG